MRWQGVDGTAFAVWAPNAARVSVVGDFNHWDGRRHPMRSRRECGMWEIFVPGVGVGTTYKYEILSREGHVLPLKADPYALQAELRPSTASIVAEMPPPVAPSDARRRAPTRWTRRSASTRCTSARGAATPTAIAS
jgi:1,4-alpha-glucan branching enzyme